MTMKVFQDEKPLWFLEDWHYRKARAEAWPSVKQNWEKRVFDIWLAVQYLLELPRMQKITEPWEVIRDADPFEIMEEFDLKSFYEDWKAGYWS